MTRVIVTAEATADIDSAIKWYGTHGSGLLLQFVDQLDRTLARIEENALQFPILQGGVRRGLLRKFPFSVYFTTEHPDTAVVLAIVHQRRHPETWKRER